MDQRVGAADHPTSLVKPDTKPLVSVVITTYNHARYLGAAIASAVAQSHRPIEVIVVDDGSTDDTPAILARHPGVTAIRQGNQGLSAARNTGLRAARGDCVLFLDADDLLLPRALEWGLARLSARPDCALAAGGYLLIDADGGLLAPPFLPEGEDGRYLALLHRNYIAMHATVLYRREALLAAGGFDTALRAAEDYDVFLRIARTRPIAHHGRPVALYRRHGGNMTEQYDRMLDSALGVLGAQREHCRGDPQREAAFRTGVRFWRRYYGGLLLLRALDRLRSPRTWKDGGEDMRTLYRHAGRQVPGIAARVGVRAGLKAVLNLLPERAGDQLRRTWRSWTGPPPVGAVDFGSLRRTTPLSACFGFDRGPVVDRYYIESFLARHAADVGGRVLEIGDNAYTLRFCGDRLARSEVLNVKPGEPQTTIVADLSDAPHIPSDSFDCIILTQTLHLIYDMPAAVRTLHRVLKPAGVLLATVPGITQIDRDDVEHWYWSLTEASAGKLFGTAFGDGAVRVEGFGNVLAAASFLYGLSSAELTPEELDVYDPCYPVTVAVRAVKGASGG